MAKKNQTPKPKNNKDTAPKKLISKNSKKGQDQLETHLKEDPTHDSMLNASLLSVDVGESVEVDFIDYDKLELQTEKSLFDSLLL